MQLRVVNINGPIIAVAGRFPMSPGARDVRYKHQTHCVHLHDYPARLLMGGQEILLRRGDVTLTRPGVVSRYELGVTGSHLCVHFHLSGKSHGVRLPTHIPAGPHSAWVAERLHVVIDLYRRTSGGRGAIAAAGASAALTELLCRLALLPFVSDRRRPAKRSDPAVAKVAERIESRFMKPLTLQSLASEVRLGADYLSRLFRSHFGIGIAQYLLQRRVEVARHLLLTTDKSVKEIAYDVGIPDAQYFNKQFRKISGLSPSALREAGSAGR